MLQRTNLHSWLTPYKPFQMIQNDAKLSGAWRRVRWERTGRRRVLHREHYYADISPSLESVLRGCPGRVSNIQRIGDGHHFTECTKRTDLVGWDWIEVKDTQDGGRCGRWLGSGLKDDRGVVLFLVTVDTDPGKAKVRFLARQIGTTALFKCSSPYTPPTQQPSDSRRKGRVEKAISTIGWLSPWATRLPRRRTDRSVLQGPDEKLDG